jgi:hypothetical protein
MVVPVLMPVALSLRQFIRPAETTFPESKNCRIAFASLTSSVPYYVRNAANVRLPFFPVLNISCVFNGQYAVQQGAVCGRYLRCWST